MAFYLQFYVKMLLIQYLMFCILNFERKSCFHRVANVTWSLEHLLMSWSLVLMWLCIIWCWLNWVWFVLSVTLQVLYKLKTAKLFDETQCNYGPDVVDSPLAVQVIGLCVESRLLCVAGKSHASLFKFSKQEAMIECVVSKV